LVPGVFAASDLRGLRALWRFASGLLIRGRFLPGLQPRGRSWASAWVPLILGEDKGYFAALVRSVPPSAWALVSEGGEESRAGEAAVLHALGELIDSLVRSASSAAKRGRRIDPNNPHEVWVRSLTWPEERLEAVRTDLRPLKGPLEDWLRPLSALAASPWRLAFRLTPPSEGLDEGTGPNFVDDRPWELAFLLQAADDPSLMAPIGEAWSGETGGLGGREYCLQALGQAAALSPAVAKGLRGVAPEGARLDLDEAAAFLTGEATALADAGFTILLPGGWTDRGRRRLALRAHPASREQQPAGAPGRLSLESLVDVDWGVLLEGAELSREELKLLAARKIPLVRNRGEWVQVDPEEIREILSFLDRAPRRLSGGELVRSALGVGEIPVEADPASEWGALVRSLSDRIFAEEPVSSSFVGTLRPYQERGYSWMRFLADLGFGACLADDMGLGKTVQTLAWLLRRKEEGAGSALLVCPTSVVENWRREAERFAPNLRLHLHHGPGRLREEAFAEAAGESDLVVTTYALLARDREILAGREWSALILDEAQNVKNPDAKQARAARSLPASARIALTGTPVENHVGDLWSLFEFLNPGLLGSRETFRRRFLLPISSEGDPEASRRLKALTAPFILRRLKTDPEIAPDLPGKFETKVWCTLRKEQASLYAAAVEEASGHIDEAEGIERRGRVLALLSKLKQICCHPALFLGERGPLEGRSGKLERLLELAEEMVAEGDRALIFSQYAEMGELLRRALSERFGREVLFLHGGVPRSARDAMVRRFQEDPEAPNFFVLSIKAGGTGLNLTRANRVVLFDRWWNPAVEAQAADRAYRIGQTRSVQVHSFVCSGTLEERIDEMIEAKRAVAAEIVGTGESVLTDLSVAELKGLLALRASALDEEG
jgi:superfamily II DNA or RNA helicase